VRLLSLSLRNYRQFLYAVITFGRGVIGISGPNGAGKSKIVEAIGYALFGPKGAILHKDRVSDIPSVDAPAGATTSVTLVFQVGAVVYTLVRGPTGARLNIGDQVQAEGATGVTAEIQRILRLTAETYLGSFVAQQNDVARLQSLRGPERQAIVNRLIGIAQIEEAIRLADSETSARKNTFAQAQDTDRLTSASATQILCHLEWDGEEKRRGLGAMEQQLMTAKEETGNASRRRNALKQQQAEAEGVQGQRDALETARLALQQHCAALIETAQQIEKDAAAAVEAQRIIDGSAEADAAVAALDLLCAITADEASLAEFVADIRDRITPEMASYHEAAATVGKLQRRIGRLYAAVSAARVQAATAQACCEETARSLRKVQQQQANAHTLGAQGRCDTCGGTFGDRLADAMAHFADEEAACATACAQAERDKTERDARRLHFEGLLEAAQALLVTAEGELKGLEAVPGQLLTVEQRRDDLGAAIARARKELPARFQNVAYDEQHHAGVRLIATQRSEAQEMLRRVGDIASLRAIAVRRLEEANSKVRDVEIKISAAMAKLATLSVMPEQLDAARHAVEDAQGVEDKLEGLVVEARREVATSDERIRRAEQDVDVARVAESKEAAALRGLTVSQQVGQLLRTVYTTLSAEARPRMEELMMEAIPALYGRRFHAVELTNDFRLLADNGTGMHDIEHFSGGEQTILAILLRIAIAQFCRERAGFDTGFLIFDEVFGNQDPEHRQALVAFLETLRERYDQIILVNHIDEVTDQLDSVLRVVPVSENVSTIGPA
jgi:DNA repair protein SbcC/Rad50